MIRFVIARLYTGTFENGVVELERTDPSAQTLQTALQQEVDQRREIAIRYTPGPDEHMIATLAGWPHEILEQTAPAIAPANAVN